MATSDMEERRMKNVSITLKKKSFTYEEVIDMWRCFQFQCIPSILLARYAYRDYIDAIRAEKTFYRHEMKKEINNISNDLDHMISNLLSVTSGNLRYMSILSDNIEEEMEDEIEEMRKAIELTFRGIKFPHEECFTALYYIRTMMGMACFTFAVTCFAIRERRGMDAKDLFIKYDLHPILDRWDKICATAIRTLLTDRDYKRLSKGRTDGMVLDLHNPRCEKAFENVRVKYSSTETLANALRKSYEWSPNYKEGQPYEESADYAMITAKAE